MFDNPMKSLPAYGAIIKNHCKLDPHDEDRTYGDLYGAVIDYLIGLAWGKLCLFPEEEKLHRGGISIMEIQAFLDWVTYNWVEELELDRDQMVKEANEGIEAFEKRQEDQE